MRLGCAQCDGVVSMSDGTVTFKGGSITNTKAVGAHWGPVRTIVGFIIGFARSRERLLDGR